MSKAEILKGKMPVTMLQEICAKNKSSLPVYQFINEEVSLHAPNVKIFTFKVSALGKQANGVGRSKQESKHEAAWQLIRLVLNLPACAEDDIVAAAGERGSLAALELGADRVCQVRDICIQRNFPLPEIELVRNYGPSHAPVFEYECRIQEIVRRGVHATKKGAKQIACQEMIKTLQSMPVEEESLQLLTLDMAIEEADETNENIIKTYREYTTSDIKKKLGVSIADRHTFFLELPQERIDEARRLLVDPNESERDKCFRIATTLGLKSKILTANPNLPMIKGSHMSTFELLNPDFDCLIIGEGEAFYTNVCEYFIRMLNIKKL
ncbi:RISC-loading complex subunit tarbp2 isoform X2 [Anopheles moucheti]|uniref:RISC-loading complex subunit tarbp2 isoform X2 n=1 Tax=Anopheles moucheti TaxID=186751 RepID=UPI0022F0C918|nr:RISC-loading complex subunit tarbp2 isoform X2 [Anopheles moucheti]